MALLSRVIAQASGGRCQPWTEEIRYMKGRRKGKENKVGEGWKEVVVAGGRVIKQDLAWHFPAISSGPPPKAT